MDLDLTETEQLLIAIHVAETFLDPDDDVWYFLTDEQGLGLIRSCPMDHECGDGLGAWWFFYTGIGGLENDGPLPTEIVDVLDGVSGYNPRNDRQYTECWEVDVEGSDSCAAHQRLQEEYLRRLDAELAEALARKAAGEPFVPAMFGWAVADEGPLAQIVTTEMLQLSW